MVFFTKLYYTKLKYLQIIPLFPKIPNARSSLHNHTDEVIKNTINATKMMKALMSKENAFTQTLLTCFKF